MGFFCFSRVIVEYSYPINVRKIICLSVCLEGAVILALAVVKIHIFFLTSELLFIYLFFEKEVVFNII